jgi:ribose 5-phosphate isomerase A
MDLKEQAAAEAVKYVEDDMVVGLGSGSTASIAIRLIGDKIRAEGLEVVGVPTSKSSDLLGRAVGIRIVDLDDHPTVDLTIDGADEIDPRLDLVKGLGGALVREKIVAAASVVEIIVADDSKLVAYLGQKAPLPVEVVRFSFKTTMRRLASLGCKPVLRMSADAPFVTDNGNYIVDCGFERIDNPASVETSINNIPGVVDNGLFVGRASKAMIGTKDGVRIMERQQY